MSRNSTNWNSWNANSAMALLGIGIGMGIGVGGDLYALADGLAGCSEAVCAVLTSGGFDLFAEVVASGPRELLDFVNDVIRPIEGVRQVQSLPDIGIHTHRFLRDVG
ncbi:Lrp/AsnC ligand binding domain-containing protein [Streptomyces sp. TLI_185]|uniref:Lrp/AsnC ligand binding domain-containing protein n=1 Tax=Streptomyces sp. TLI_185 TaxID=2485151 RepID=UPI0021A32CFC|nr:Lrp/AsnC ligand binding domain-containing protein [Streptomyces sp. TLI_185]